MLESIIKAEKMEKRPFEMFFLAIAMTMIATALAAIVSPDGAGHLVIAFVCIGAAPIMVRVITLEEKESAEVHENEVRMLARHGDMFAIFGWFFLGIIVAVSFLFIMMPAEMEQTMFGPQLQELQSIKGLATGRVTSSCGIFCLFQNNFGVLLLVLLFSFVFGAGAVYIITWNASIVGVLIGMTAKAETGNVLLNYVVALPISLIKLFPHGIFEVGAYFFGGLAGGMLSAMIVRGDWKRADVFKDVLAVFLIATLLVAIGAIIEGM